MKKMNKTALFLILTFVISYSLAGIYVLTGGSFNNRLGFTLLGVVYMFVPTLCVLLVKKVIHRENIVDDLMVSFKLNKWFLVAWLIMPLIAFSTLGISLLFPGVVYSPEMTGMFERFENMMTPEQMEEMKKSFENLPINPVWITLGQGLLAGITINAVAAFGEELGWRGFLLKQFKGMKFMKASLIIGFIWGIWHAPLILMGHNYPQHPEIGVGMMTLLCMFLSPILVYLTLKANSVIAAAIVHGTMNAVAGISIMMISGGNDLTAGITGIAGFITLVIFTLCLFLYDYYISKDKIFIKEII